MKTITGYKGFIGGALLARCGCEKLILIEKEDGLRHFYQEPIYHIGALSGIQECQDNPVECIEHNIVSTAAWAAHAFKHNCTRFVFTSSVGAVPGHHYGFSKLAGESIVKRILQDKSVILRLANVYGPGSYHKTSMVAKMCKDALTKGEIQVHGTGEQKRDLVYIEDVLDALLEAPLGYFGAVATGKMVAVKDVARFIAELTDVRVKYVNIFPRKEIARDTAKMARLDLNYLGWQTGVEKTVNWFRKEMEKTES